MKIVPRDAATLLPIIHCNGVAVGLYVYSIGLLSMRGREHVDVQCGRQ